MALDIGIVVLTVVLGSLVIGLCWSLRRKPRSDSAKGKSNVTKKDGGKKKNQPATGKPASSKKKDDNKPNAAKESKATFTHSWLLTSLKGHTGPLSDMDFSPDGKYLATCSEDRTVMLWQLKLGKLDRSVTTLNMKDIKTVKVHVQYDSASLIRWSPDSKALVTVRMTDNYIEIYKVAKKTDGDKAQLLSVNPTHSFSKHREADLLACEIASNGRFIMTCTAKNELDLIDLKGNALASITTNQMETYFARISPDGQLVASSGFTPEVRVWEVVYTRSGEFEKIGRAFELTGHTSGIYSFDFSPDCSKMVSVGKDGTWRLYNTNINYKQGQLATLIVSGKWKATGQAPARIALSPDCRVVAIGCGTSIYLFSALNAELCGHIQDAHTSPIKAVRFDATSRFVLSTGDKYVRVFHNVPGYKIAAQDLETKLRLQATGGQALKERLQQQLKEAQSLAKLFDD